MLSETCNHWAGRGCAKIRRPRFPGAAYRIELLLRSYFFFFAGFFAAFFAAFLVAFFIDRFSLTS